MTNPNNHTFIFQLPVLHDDNGRGYVSMAQEAENVYWRCGLLGVEKGHLGVHLMCNSEDRSNFWSIDFEYEACIVLNGKEHHKKTGTHHHIARKYLALRFPLDFCRKAATKEKGMYIKFSINVVNKVGIRPKRIHDFTVPEENLTNFILVVEGKKIYCSKQILAMNSEVLMQFLYPNGNKEVREVELPENFEYKKLLTLIKIFYNDSDALNPSNISEALEVATNMKSESARQRCERWISRTQLMAAKKKMHLAEKFSLVDLQNECIAMLKTSQQVQRLFQNPHDFTDEEIVELMDRVTLSIVGHSYEGLGK